MILHPGAHFGIPPRSHVGGGTPDAPSARATPNRGPPNTSRTAASPLAHADFASSPPRHLHRVFHGYATATQPPLPLATTAATADAVVARATPLCRLIARASARRQRPSKGPRKKRNRLDIPGEYRENGARAKGSGGKNERADKGKSKAEEESRRMALWSSGRSGEEGVEI